MALGMGCLGLWGCFTITAFLSGCFSSCPEQGGFFSDSSPAETPSLSTGKTQALKRSQGAKGYKVDEGKTISVTV